MSDGLKEFADHRDLLFTVAYEITGSVADAEDVVQESYLRWSEISDDDRVQIRNPKAYLASIATRQPLNRLRTQTRRREEYVGPWLPEPLVTAPDIADDVVLELNTLGDRASRDAYRTALVEYFSAHRDALSPDSLLRLERDLFGDLSSTHREELRRRLDAPSAQSSRMHEGRVRAPADDRVMRLGGRGVEESEFDNDQGADAHGAEAKPRAQRQHQQQPAPNLE